MTNFSYDEARMMAVVDELGGITQQIGAMLTRLESDTRASMREWTSDAKYSYEFCKAQWDASAARMPQLLGQASSIVPQVLECYRRGDREGQRLWHGTPTGRH